MKILKAVATLLEDPGTKITINRIATHVSVTEAAIYRHYRSKEDIFAALMAYMESNFITPINAVQQQTTDTYTRVKFLFDAYMEFLEGHPGLARLLLGHGNTEAVGVTDKAKLLNAKIRSQVALMLKHGAASGSWRSALTPEQGAELFYSLVVAVAMEEMFRLPQLDRDHRWDMLATALFGPVAGVVNA
jgi:TetR/AcrR family transcriptional regulator